jgi:hypothetical protein
LAIKPFIYKIEDTESGAIYEIEGPEGATAEELGAFITSQNQAPVDAPSSSLPKTGAVSVDQGVASQAPDMIQQEQETVAVRSSQKGGDIEWMDPEFKATVDNMYADPSVSRKQITDSINAHAREKGLMEFGDGAITGTEEDLAKYREAVAAGQAPIAAGYERAGLKELGLNEAEPTEAPAEGEMGFFEQIGAAVEQSAQEGFGGVLARNIYDLMDVGKDEMRKLYPDITEDQLDDLTDFVVATAQKDLLRANEIKNKNSDWLPWLAGQFLGSGSPVDAFIPGGGKLVGKVVSGAGSNALEDVAVQGANVYQGVQDEYRPEQTVMAAGLGGVLGGVIHGAGVAGGKLMPRQEFDVDPSARVEGDPYVVAPTGRKNSKAYKQGMAEAVAGGQDKVAELTAGWKDAPDIVVHDSFDKLDGVDSEALGVIGEDGIVNVNMAAVIGEAKALNKTPDEVLTAITFHEALGHYGLAKNFGEDLDFNLQTWYDEGTSGFRKDVDDWMAANPDSYKGRPDQLVRAAEEVIVEWSEAGKLTPSMYNRMINSIKKVLRGLDIEMKFSKRELETILGMAHYAVAEGRPGGSLFTKKKYSMQSDLTREIRRADNPRLETQRRALEANSRNIRQDAWRQKSTEGEPYQTGKYMYAGRNAQNAPVKEMERAIDLEDAGWPSETIRSQTGWHMPGDGQWRFEIADNEVTLNQPFDMLERIKQDGGELPRTADQFLKHNTVLEALANKKFMDNTGINAFSLEQVIDHPELFEAYPFLRDIDVSRDKDLYDPKNELNGAFYPGELTISGRPAIYLNPGRTTKQAQSTLLHEVQHAVQDFEGFARGGSPEDSMRVIPGRTIIANSGHYYTSLRRDAKTLKVKVEALKGYAKNPIVLKLRDAHKRWTDAMIDEADAPNDGSLSATLKRSEVEAEYMQIESDLTESLGFGRELEDMSPRSAEQFAELLDLLIIPRTMTDVYNGIREISLESKQADMSATKMKEYIETRNVSGIRMILKKDKDAQFEAYRHIFGEVEARDVQARQDMSAGERSAVEPYSQEPKLDPESFIYDLDQTRAFDVAGDPPIRASNDNTNSSPAKKAAKYREDAKSSRAQALKNRKVGKTAEAESWEAQAVREEELAATFAEASLSRDKYSRRKTNDDVPDLTSDEIPYTPKASKAFLQQIEDDYVPIRRSWAEAKAEARRNGMTAKQIRSAKSVGELDKKLFQYEAVARKTDETIARLNKKLNTPSWTLTDKQKYIEATYSQAELLGRIVDDQGEIGRAMNAIKALAFTRRNLSELNQTLRDFEGDSGIAAFASDDVFNEFAAKVKYMMENGNPQGARKMLQSVVKPYWWQYVLSFRHAMMLSGLGTQAKNITDNGLMLIREAEEAAIGMIGFPIRAAARAVGKALPFENRMERIVDGVSPQEVASRVYGIVSAAFDMHTYKNSWEALQKGHGNSEVSSKIEMQDAHIPGISKVTDFLHAADVFFRAFHNNANLYSLGVREARNQGFTGAAAFQEGTNMAHTPTTQMLRDSKQLTDTALLVDTPSQLGQMIEAGKSIRPGMSGGRQAFAFGMNIAAPFLRVTDRLIFQKIRRSPLAFLDKNTRKEIMEGGPKMDIAIGRAMFGSYLIAKYWEAAGEGEIVGEGPSNYQKREALEGGGWMDNSVIEDGKYVDTTALNLSLLPDDLHNATASNVASIREAHDKGEDVTGSLALAMKALMSALGEESFANSLEPYVAAFDKKDEEGVQGANAVGSLASQFVPAAARQLNQQVLDTTKRNTTGDRSFEDRVKGRVMSGIPGLSNKLPAKYDVYGDVKTQGRSTLAMSNYREIKSDDVAKELFRLEKASKDTLISPTKGSFSSIDAVGADLNPVYVAKVSDKGLITMTGVGREELQRVQGYWIRQWMAEEMASSDYGSMTDEEKFALAKDIRKDAGEAAKEHMLPLVGLGEDASYEEDE